MTDSNQGLRMGSEVRPDKQGVFPRLLNDVIVRMVGNLSLTGGRGFRFGLMRTQGGIFLGLSGQGAGEFSTAVGYHQVASCFPRLCEQDAANLTDFINDQLGMKFPRFGKYDARLCAQDGENDVYE